MEPIKAYTDIQKLEEQQLNKACDAVIDALKPFTPPVKIAALHTLIDSFPVEYLIVTKKKQLEE